MSPPTAHKMKRVDVYWATILYQALLNAYVCYFIWYQNCFKIYWVLYSDLRCFWSVVSTYLWILLLPICAISSQLNYLLLPKYAPLICHIYNCYHSIYVNAFLWTIITYFELLLYSHNLPPQSRWNAICLKSLLCSTQLKVCT